MPRKRRDVAAEPTTGRVVAIQFRMTQSLRDALGEAADRNQTSINTEIARRVQASFSEERALGGPGMRRLAYTMITAFDRAGRLRAGSKENWIEDPDCYRAAMFGVIDALLIGAPHATAEDIAREIEGLKGKLLTRVMAEEQRQ